MDVGSTVVQEVLYHGLYGGFGALRFCWEARVLMVARSKAESITLA